MVPVGGDYPIPDSQEQYENHPGLIDIIIPANGGRVLPDGSWLQESWRIDTPFSQSLPTAARVAGHRYMPTVEARRETLQPLLETPDVWPVAARNLVRLALEGRFDSPWQGVIYDMIGIYQVEHYEFMRELACSVRRAGLPFGISITGKRPGDAPGLLETAAQICDIFICYCYCFWESTPGYSMQPYWWTAASIENAIAKGIPHERIYLGLANYANYWPMSGGNTFHEITYQQTMELTREAGGHIEWIERGPSGLIREKRADLGDGYIWFQDGDTIRPRLRLVDEYDLAGMMLFIPGMGDESVWQAIAEWKRPKRTRPAGMSSRIGANGGYLVPSGRAVSWPTRP